MMSYRKFKGLFLYFRFKNKSFWLWVVLASTLSFTETITILNTYRLVTIIHMIARPQHRWKFKVLLSFLFHIKTLMKTLFKESHGYISDVIVILLLYQHNWHLIVIKKILSFLLQSNKLIVMISLMSLVI